MSEIPVSETQRISIDVPVEVHKALKMSAASLNMSIKMFVMRLVIAELERMGAVKIK